jgi:pantoate--beta-alanine ligase
MTDVASSRAEAAAARAALPGSVALVPTMGALHEGHRSLLRRARAEADQVVVSVFVNPLQFGPNEDLDRYPRTLEHDLEMCAAEGVALVFAPTRSEMYPAEPVVTVTGGALAARFEGATRPGHFDGVLTVVAKLFHLVHPDLAVFGRKDAQQLALVNQMVTDLDLPVAIIGAPIVREPDGLALSSRNRFLSPSERTAALSLSTGLSAGVALAIAGTPAVAVLDGVRAVLDAAPGVATDYVALVDAADFSDLTVVPPVGGRPALLLVAAKVGTTRLIDNMAVTVVTAVTPDAPEALEN